MPFPITDYNPKPLPDFSETTVKPALDIKPVRDFSNLDDLITELNNPKEVINNAGPVMPGATPPQMINDFPFYERPPITKEDATRTGKYTAKTIDTSFSIGFNLYAKEKEDTSKFKATDSEIADLSEACSDISEAYNFKMSPIPNLIMVLIFIYGPKFYLAKEEKWKNETKQRLEAAEKKHDDLEEIVTKLQKQIMEMQKNA
jgi:hypothetical protein